MLNTWIWYCYCKGAIFYEKLFLARKSWLVEQNLWSKWYFLHVISISVFLFGAWQSQEKDRYYFEIYRIFAEGLPVFFIASIWLQCFFIASIWLQWVTDFVGRYLAILNSSINFLIYCLVFPDFIITIGICVRIFDKIDRPSSVYGIMPQLLNKLQSNSGQNVLNRWSQLHCSLTLSYKRSVRRTMWLKIYTKYITKNKIFNSCQQKL